MLELTLALPMLLMVMALIINAGTQYAWKVRSQSIARLQVWETRWPRSGGNNPTPEYWTAKNAAASVSGATNISALDDSRVDLPVARGPLPAATVNSDLLDPSRGLREGASSLTRDFPLLAKMGPYKIDTDTFLLDDKWQYPRMGMGSNWQRRIPVIYSLAKAPASMVRAYVQSVLAIANAPFAAALRPLDKDDEFIYYGMLFGWGGPPDFHPRLGGFCSTNRDQTDRLVESLILRVQGSKSKRAPSLAEDMARAFLGLYRRALSAFKAILQQKNPPAPAAMISLANAQIPQLEAKIDILKKFLAKAKAFRGD